VIGDGLITKPVTFFFIFLLRPVTIGVVTNKSEYKVLQSIMALMTTVVVFHHISGFI